MTHPKFRKTKIYEVTLDSDLEPLHQQMINDYGVQLEDGASKLLLNRLSDTDRKKWQIIMSEGRNRQIRRTFAALGYTVVMLHRTHFGAFSLDNLAPGNFEVTTP
jgi:23S rRNA pseudouridine2605 synthase